MKQIVYLLILVFLLTCCNERHPYSGTTYVYTDNSTYETEFHAISLDGANYFTYLLFTKSGSINEKVEGEYEISKDTLNLKIIYPIEFNVQKTAVLYSNHGSKDSIYFMVFELPPKILRINRNRYRKISSSLIYDCQEDTCQTFYPFESKKYGWASNGTNIEKRKNYNSAPLDTFNFFDPNDDLIDKKVPVNWGKNNCVKVYLALNPKYDLIKIPMKFAIGKNILMTEFENIKRKYALLYKHGVDLNKK